MVPTGDVIGEKSVYVEWIARRKFSKHGALVLPHSTKRKEERKPIT